MRYNISIYLFICIALTNLSYSFDSQRSSVIRTEYGFIDYANRVIVSRGTANIIEKNINEDEFQIIEKNLKFSKSEARSNARKPIRPNKTC